MNNALKLFSSLELRKLPQDALITMMEALEAEYVRRTQEAKQTSDMFSIIRKRINGNKLAKRHQEHLFLPEWKELYPEVKGNSERKYYVYAHMYPNDGCMEVKLEEDYYRGIRIFGIPFYIGKGTGERAYDLNRNQGHGKELKNLLNDGVKPDKIVQILLDDLTENEAFMYESKLIYLFGTKYEQGIKGFLVNLDIPKRPERLNVADYEVAPRELK